VKLGTNGAVAPLTPLTSLPAFITENDPPAVKRQKKAVKNNISAEFRRSARIAAARSMAVADLDSTANNKEPAEQTRKLMLLAQVCATEDVAKGDKDFEEKQGEEPKLTGRQPKRPGGEALRYAVGGTRIGRFHEYPQMIVALLELEYLKELEQGVFLSVSDPSQRKRYTQI
jgi:hypothetical protein